jgi:hypothetical protein
MFGRWQVRPISFAIIPIAQRHPWDAPKRIFMEACPVTQMGGFLSVRFWANKSDTGHSLYGEDWPIPD